MDNEILLIKLPGIRRARTTSPMLVEALDTGKRDAPLAEALASLSDQFLETVIRDARPGVAGKAALLVLAVSRACKELGAEELQVRKKSLLRWYRCMRFLLNLEHLRRIGVIRSIHAEPISDPNSVLIFS
ncbi:MAG: hypothetical protein GTO55_04075 [Armatimonadetes bacterium]|nr:hypothetical protein [Armatimonadota bacterium]NIM23450.1 hypothetical protein [Armatimonadota bacterium]NIM67315.1 hypothetical protein [Armatimonadota bacterium]NIM75813.1 hypothetical protein [Armatimonadota bacterium]NIN05501.1 hypothetical protein [Armatimonadota bacterium]